MNDYKSSDRKNLPQSVHYESVHYESVHYESPCEKIARTAYDNCLKVTRMPVCPESFYLRVLADCTHDPRKYVKSPPGILYD